LLQFAILMQLSSVICRLSRHLPSTTISLTIKHFIKYVFFAIKCKCAVHYAFALRDAAYDDVMDFLIFTHI